MGHRCCSRQKVKRGLWSPEEDDKLVTHITSHGHGSWSSVPKLAGLQRCGKSCRLRWINYLRPDLRRGSFTEEEERTIIEVHRILGNRWAQIAKHLPGRTDNEVKNFWNSCIKKKLLAQGLDPNTHNLLPSLHKKSKNNSSHRIPSPVSSSLAFSIDQTSSHDNVISNVTQTRFSPMNDEVELELKNIQFGCNHPKEPQNHSNNAKSADFTTQCFELNTVKMSNDSCSSFDINLCDMIVDENSLWDAALGNLEQPLSNTTQVFEQQHFSETFDKTGTTRQEEVICDEKFEASFNNSAFDSCFQEGHNSTILANSIYGDIVSVMEQIAWGNC